MPSNTSSDNIYYGDTPIRHPTKELAQVEVYGRIGKVFCRMANLSTTGACLEIVSSKYSPRKGDIVRVTVALRQLNKTHTLDAEIVWCKGLGLGISFLKKDQIYEKLAART